MLRNNTTHLVNIILIFRKRRQFRHWDEATSAAEHFWASHESARYYKNEQVLEREALERRLHAELEERKRRDRMPLPTFEQLWKREEEVKRQASAQWWRTAAGMTPIFLLFAYLFSYHH